MQTEYDLNTLQIKRHGPLPGLQEQADTTRVRVTMMLDTDIVSYFKEMAEQPGNLSYKTYINQALRQIIHQPGVSE
ncbi:MAG: BrnA antitoxin family protein [Pseudomonadota bacterium]